MAMKVKDEINEIIDEYGEKLEHAAKRSTKVVSGILTIALLVMVLLVTDWLFKVYTQLQPYVEYKIYIYAGEIFLIGALAIEQISRGLGEMGEAIGGAGVGGAFRGIARIVGYGVLLSVLASVFNVSPVAALTLGSFMGLVAGFALQKVLGNAVAGMFIIFSRPFCIGDKVKLLGKYEGTVKDITVMYTILDTGDKLVYVPSSKVVGDVFEKAYPKICGEKSSN